MNPSATSGTGHPSLASLSREECVVALRQTRLGRVATTVGPERRPLIRPISYLYDVDSRSIVFHSLPGTKLHALLDRRDVCFEIDGEQDGAPWSVIVRGRVETEDRPNEIARLERSLSPRLAVPREGPWLRIRAEVITGVRLTARP